MSEPSDREATCPVCAAPVIAGARFCGGCGARLVASPPPGATPGAMESPDPAPSSAPRRPPGLDGRGLWGRLVPALQLWIALLAINGVLGLSSHIVDVSSPWFDLWATAVAAVVVIGFCANDRSKLAPLLRGSGISGRSWWYPVAVLLGIGVFMHGYIWCLSWVGVEEYRYLEGFLADDWPLWSAFLLVSVAPAVLEELAFRGVILSRLDELMGPREAIGVQAAMFSVLHMSPVIFVSHFVMGVVFGVLRRSTGSLYPGMVVHALWNGWVLSWEVATAQ